VRRYTADPILLREVGRRCRALNPASKTERFAHHIVRYAENGY
jgi:hypothetical protein